MRLLNTYDGISIEATSPIDPRIPTEAQNLIDALERTPANQRLSNVRRTIDDSAGTTISLETDKPNRRSGAHVQIVFQRRDKQRRKIRMSFRERILADQSNLPDQDEPHLSALAVAYRLRTLLRRTGPALPDGDDPLLRVHRAMLAIACHARQDPDRFDADSPMVVVESGSPYGLVSCCIESMREAPDGLLDPTSTTRLTSLLQPSIRIGSFAQDRADETYLSVDAGPRKRRSRIDPSILNPTAHAAAVRDLSTLGLSTTRSTWL